MKTVLCTGGYDPLHSGHIEYFKAAKSLGDYLIVGINSDDWLARKKGRSFMEWEERAAIVSNLSVVDEVIAFDDSDDTACCAIQHVIDTHPDNSHIIFANGGDRTKHNIPEMVFDNVEFEFGVGGENKKNSSSWILKNWKYPTEQRVWGKFSNLFQDDVVKVKELIIQPGQGISYQRHFKRSEIWFVSKGTLNVKHSFRHHTAYRIHTLNKDDVFTVHQGDWHQAFNTSDQPCHIIEIQFGSETNEDDIERLEYYNGDIQ